MIHINKRDKVFDPYFAVGLKWLTGHMNDMEQEWGAIPYPLLNAGFGVRYMVTPTVGLFGEAAVSNLLFLAWQVEGRVGVSIGF